MISIMNILSWTQYLAISSRIDILSKNTEEKNLNLDFSTQFLSDCIIQSACEITEHMV